MQDGIVQVEFVSKVLIIVKEYLGTKIRSIFKRFVSNYALEQKRKKEITSKPWHIIGEDE